MRPGLLRLRGAADVADQATWDIVQAALLVLGALIDAEPGV